MEAKTFNQSNVQLHNSHDEFKIKPFKIALFLIWTHTTETVAITSVVMSWYVKKEFTGALVQALYWNLKNKHIVSGFISQYRASLENFPTFVSL